MMNLAWKIVPGLSLDDEGFSPNVLAKQDLSLRYYAFYFLSSERGYSKYKDLM